MKKLLAILPVLFCNYLPAQTVLTYQNHALLPGHPNHMKLSEYTNPGAAGKNVVWDFTSLNCAGDFAGSSDEPSALRNDSTFNEANVVIGEFGSTFYFRVTDFIMEQHGYKSEDGLTRIHYSEPFVKMKFPFAFGDAFAGNYKGIISSGCTIGLLDGRYATEADATGTLLLPNDVTYDNALRVREAKIYDQRVGDTSTHVEIVTYRWYINENRYPLLTLIRKHYNYANGKSKIETQAAYNPKMIIRPGSPYAVNSLASDLKFVVFPNPSSDRFTASFKLDADADVHLAIYALSGAMIKELISGRLAKGEHSREISSVESGMGRGPYLMILAVNGVVTTVKILRQ